MKIVDIMKPVHTIHPDATLAQAVEMMVCRDINLLIIIDDTQNLLWCIDIVTLMKAITPEYIWNRDMSVANFVNEEMFTEFIEKNKTIPVKNFMLETPKSIKITSSVMEAAIKVTEWRQSRILVLDEYQHPIGMVSSQEIKHFIGTKMWFNTSKCR